MKFLTSDLIQNSFSEMALADNLKVPLDAMKITIPTPIQQQAIPLALSKADFIGIAPTGSGKTLVYALTILTRLQEDPTSRALVLTPSRETADQIFNVFNSITSKLNLEKPLSMCLVVAGNPDKKQVSQLNKLPRLIVATPGRLLDHLSNNKLLLQKMSLLVIDEADRMLDVGFGPQLKNIKATMRGDFQTLMFGASFNKASEKFSAEFFKSDCILLKVEGANKPVNSLKQIVCFTEYSQKNDRLFDAVKNTTGLCIVFVNNQPYSETIQKHLAANGVSTDVIHGSMKHGHRDRVIRDFRDGKFRVLVTTDLLARGLDVPNIELVVNFDLPSDTEDFLHRIGRTARAGQSGTALSLVTASEQELYKKIKPYLEGAEEIHDEPRSNPKNSYPKK